MTTREDDDPTRAALRVAEGVVGLVRAEVGLAAAQARAKGSRLALTLALTAAALFLSALAVVVLVFTPLFWVVHPAAAMATLGIAVVLALVASLVTLKRWSARPKSNVDERPSSHPHQLPGRDPHAIPR